MVRAREIGERDAKTPDEKTHLQANENAHPRANANAGQWANGKVGKIVADYNIEIEIETSSNPCFAWAQMYTM